MGFLQFTHRAFLFHLSPKFPSFPSSASPSRGEQHTSVLTGGSAHPDILWRQEGAINSGMRPLAGVLQVLTGAGQDVGSKAAPAAEPSSNRAQAPPMGTGGFAFPHLYPSFFSFSRHFSFSLFPPYYFSFSATHTTPFLFLLCNFFFSLS